jgi:hypothetical protein
MNAEIVRKMFDLMNTNSYHSISNENCKYEEGDVDEPIDWFDVVDEILNCKKITDMVDYKGYIQIDYVDNNEDCIFMIEYHDDIYQDKMNALNNENQKLKKILHKALKLDDTIEIGKFDDEDNNYLFNLKLVNQKLRNTIIYVLKKN